MTLGEVVDETSADIEAIRQSLLEWREEGLADPKIYVEAGPGELAGVFGLNDRDQVVRILGATVDDTVAVSNGDGLETDKTGVADG
jgi:hypothetical protein